MEETDRWTRRRMGNPIIKAVIEKVAGEKFVEYYEEPYLTIEGGYVEDFRYIGSEPSHHRRFILVKVTNDGLRSAVDCWAQITIPELGLENVPLHWADESYEIKRNSMDMITIPPRVSRDLDVAFSVYGEEYDKGISLMTGDAVIVTGKIIGPSTWKSSTTTQTRPSTSTLGGTYDPRFVPTGARQVGDFHKESDPKLKGSWLASHLVIANPRENSDHYLPPDFPPKRYDCELQVICGNGKGDETSITIISSIEPSGLIFDWRKTPTVSSTRAGD